MKRILCLALALSMFMGLCAPATAAINPPDTTQASNYFISYGTTLSDKGGHVMHITFSTVGMGLCSQLGVSTYTVQKLVKLEDGSTTWADVTGLVSGQTGSNVSSYTYGVNFQGVAGETYRVRCTFICTKNGSSETKSYTSPRLKIK